MLRLNLLSSEQKINLKNIKITRLFYRLAIIIVTLSIAVSIVLFLAKIIINKNYQKLTAAEVNTTTQTLNNKVVRVNKIVSFIESTQTANINWSNVLQEIAIKTPSNINFSLLEIDKEKQTLSLAGIARERNDLLDLKDELEKSILFKNVNLPKQNIAEKENINFNITAEIDLDSIE